MKKYLIDRCVRLAYLGIGRTAPNPSVGCIIERDGEIVGEGYHLYSKVDHAEVVALKRAGERARGGTMYVSLEPCFHHGRTPPCVDRIIDSGIKKVVILMKDPNPLVSGKSIKKLIEHKIEVKVIEKIKKLQKLNEDFEKFITKKIPFIAIKIASTLDGKIATKDGNSRWITSEKSRKYTHFLRFRYNSILVGINTILKDNPLLTCRYSKKKDIPFYRFIIDPDLKIPEDARILRHVENSPVVIFTRDSSAKKIDGAKVIEIPFYNGKMDIKYMLMEIYKLNVSSILIEGGGYTITKFIESGFSDKLHIFFSNKILGKGVSFFSPEIALSLKNSIKLKFDTFRKFGEDVLLNYYFK